MNLRRVRRERPWRFDAAVPGLRWVRFVNVAKGCKNRSPYSSMPDLPAPRTPFSISSSISFRIRSIPAVQRSAVVLVGAKTRAQHGERISGVLENLTGNPSWPPRHVLCAVRASPCPAPRPEGPRAPRVRDWTRPEGTPGPVQALNPRVLCPFRQRLVYQRIELRAIAKPHFRCFPKQRLGQQLFRPSSRRKRRTMASVDGATAMSPVCRPEQARRGDAIGWSISGREPG